MEASVSFRVYYEYKLFFFNSYQIWNEQDMFYFKQTLHCSICVYRIDKLSSKYLFSKILLCKTLQDSCFM